MMTMRVTNLLLIGASLAALSLAPACTANKKKGGAGNSVAKDDKDADGSGAKGKADPCATGLRLQDADDDAPDSDDADTPVASTPGAATTDDAATGDTAAADASANGAAAGNAESDGAAGAGSTTADGCKPSASDQSTKPADDGDGSTDTATSPAAPSGSAKAWTAGPGLDGCAADGKAWMAVVNGGSAACGDPLVDWCCTEENIASRFPTLRAKLKEKFDTYKSDGLKLYHCSMSGTRTTFHWASGSATGVKYKTAYVDIAPVAVPDSAVQCTAVTASDLGFSDDVGVGGDSDDSTGGGTGGGGSAGTIPASIGALASTTPAAILTFLKTPSNYGSWTRDAAIRTSAGPHGKVRTFYDPLTTDFRRGDSLTVAKGGIVIKELYDDASKLKGWALMGKAAAGSGAGTWFFYEITGAPGFTGTPSAYAVGAPAACVNCHASGNDYLKTLAN